MSMRWTSIQPFHLIPITLIIAFNHNFSVSETDVFSCFILYTNRYLEKSGAVFIGNLSSATECLERCLQANRLNFVDCQSVMWRRDTNDCVLSRYTSFASTRSVTLGQVTMANTLPTPTADSLEKYFDRRVQASPIRPTLVTNPLNRTDLIDIHSRSQKQPIYSPTGPDTFYKVSQTKTVPLISSDSIDSRPNVVAVSGDSVVPSPIRSQLNRHVHVFRKNQVQLARNVRGSVILIPAKGANPIPPTIAPSFTTAIKPIRPGPVTRHYYRPDAPGPFTTTTPSMSPELVVDSEQVIDSEPLVLLGGQQKRPNSIVSSGFRATISPLPSTSITSLTTRPSSPSTLPTIISRTTPSGRELADAPCFLKFPRRALPNFEEKVINGVTLRECLVSCLYTSDLYCASVNHDFNRKMCIINGGSASLTKTALQTSKSVDYYENICPPPQPRVPEQTALPVSIISRCLTPIVNTVLEDLDASVITSVQTLEECQSECLRGRWRRGKQCGAMNWIPSMNGGCMLFPPQYDRQQLAFSTQATFYINLCTEETFDGPTRVKTKNDYYDDFAQ